MKIDRRTFLVGSGGIFLNTAPSDQIVLGVIGSGGRGLAVMRAFQRIPDVRVGAICDVYEPNLEKGLAAAALAPGNQPKSCRNYKELLDDKQIQAVLISTPEHWQNFIECVQSRKSPTAPMALGFQAALVVQMANISLKQGRRVRWDANRQQVDL